MGESRHNSNAQAKRRGLHTPRTWKERRAHYAARDQLGRFRSMAQRIQTRPQLDQVLSDTKPQMRAQVRELITPHLPKALRLELAAETFGV